MAAAIMHRSREFSLAAKLLYSASNQAGLHIKVPTHWAQVIWFPQQAYYSSGTSPASAQPALPHKEEDTNYTYVGPFSNAVGRVKKLSLFSLACAVSAGPVILALDGGATLNAKLSIAATLGGFGAFTTGLLHWFTHPYVHKLIYDAADDTIEVQTLTFLAGHKTQKFPVASVQEANTMHPLASFSVGDAYYHVDAEHFKDKDLLARLVPQTAPPPEEGLEENQLNASHDTKE